MAQAAFNAPQGNPVVRWAMIGLGVLLFLALAWFVYRQMTDIDGVSKKPDTTITAAPDLLPPPPPPPPPPKPVEKPPEPTDVPKPSPEQAAPKSDAPKPMTMNAEATAGAGGIAAGDGTGGGAPGGPPGTCLKPPCGGGGGFSDALYRGNLGRELQDRILDNDRVNRLAFRASFAISVNSAGQVSRAELLTSSGDPKRDQILLAILRSARGLDPPPSQVKFPQRVTITGRRSF